MPQLCRTNNGDWPTDIDNLDKNKKLSNMYEDQFEMMFGKSMKYLKKEYNNLQKEKKDNGQDK
jgi:hypothetical protein